MRCSTASKKQRMPKEELFALMSVNKNLFEVFASMKSSFSVFYFEKSQHESKNQEGRRE